MGSCLVQSKISNGTRLGVECDAEIDGGSVEESKDLHSIDFGIEKSWWRENIEVVGAVIVIRADLWCNKSCEFHTYIGVQVDLFCGTCSVP